ncbi:tetratricopeptide repeat protein [Candidatus Parcubacteria bacterium]|nr:tetratricopeptide repeat protein [Candidatus Parcubacteria bacterium]
MNQFRRFFVPVAILLVGIIAVSFIAYKDSKNKQTTTEQPQESNATTTTNVGGIQIVQKGKDGKAVVTTLPSDFNQNIKAPDLKRTIAIPKDFTPAQASEITKKINLVTATLTKDPSQYNEWMNLAIYRKAINDLEGARLIWLYITSAFPTDPIAYLNLADLYGYYLHNNVKAEEYFIKAINISPTNSSIYLRTYQFYIDIGNTTKAKAILDKGITETGDSELKLVRQTIK